MKFRFPPGPAGDRGRSGASRVRIISVAGLSVAACAALAVPAIAAVAAPSAHQTAAHHASLDAMTTHSAALHSTITKVYNARGYVDSEIELSAHVYGGRLPTGTVHFNSGTRWLCTAHLDNGVAHCTTFFINSGWHGIKGTYWGDSGHRRSAGLARVQVVKARTRTAASAKPASAATGALVRLIANVASASPVRASGYVTFSDSAGTLCANLKLSAGRTVCAHRFGAAGTYSVKETYSGDSAHYGSNGTVTVKITAAAATTTTTTITSITPGTVQAGSPAEVAVKVTSADGSAPTGTVTVAPTDVDAPIPAGYECTVTLTAASDGAGECTVTPPVGTYGQITYEATYSGDATHTASASDGTYILIVPDTTTTTVGPATSATTTVTLTATVVDEGDGDISPDVGGTGTVAFSVNGTPIASCAAQPLTYEGGGDNVATCRYTFAGVGTDTVKAAYSGDDYNDPSSGTVSIVVG